MTWMRGVAAPMNEALKSYRIKYESSRVPDDFSYDWSSMGTYMARIDRQGAALNIAPVIGHGTVRENVFGYDSKVPSKAELEEMKKIVQE